MEPSDVPTRDVPSRLTTRSRRGWWFLLGNAIAVLLLLGFWAYAAVVLWPGWFGAFWIAVLLVYLIAAPKALRRRFRRLDRTARG